VGAPRPAASPFLSHDHCARYGCERSPSRQAKTIHFAVGGGCRADEPKWHAVRLEKKIAFVQCAASAASTFCVFSMAPKNRISLPDCC